MKNLYLLPLLCLWVACAAPKADSQPEVAHESEPVPLEQVDPRIQPILDSAQVDGTVLIFDPQADVFYSNDFEWARKGYLPASTFKIPNSMIALETGVVESDSSIFHWDGTPRRMEIWEADLTLRQAFLRSCVPCYQEVARGVGVERMNEHLTKFSYGNMLIDSSILDVFWLDSDFKITPFEQVDFLSRFYQEKLPIQNRTYELMRTIMVLDENESYTLSGKTGWAIRNGNNKGWFVGFIEKGQNVYFFATHIAPHEDFNMDLFAKIRSQITMEAFKALEII